ncbi:hypothetical protein Cgig2_012720 [Carnegiea gigantea]|uniref:Uncharacterized protein n=1 Tax=Carnegiea gigantea TaxID=171969 RepID=A0A9Q1GK20_9CARY|nr:hypothetical protein Cgig2_012720 [Carnegiea gigantea]
MAGFFPRNIKEGACDRKDRHLASATICFGVASLVSKGASFSCACFAHNKELGQNQIESSAEEACRGQKEVILKISQFRQPVQRLPITRFTPFLLWPPHRFYHLGYKFKEGPLAVIFPYIVVKVAGCPHFLFGRFLKRIHDRLLIILIEKVPLT